MNKCKKCGRPLEKGVTGKCKHCNTKSGNVIGKIGGAVVTIATIVLPIILKRKK
ncbi:hypothetical protein AB4Z21_37850 [Paenibacillus sp. MCAF20]